MLTELIEIGRAMFPGHVGVVAERDSDDQCMAGIIPERGAHQAKEALRGSSTAAKKQQGECHLSCDEKSMSAIGAHAESHGAGAGEQDAIGFGAAESKRRR